MVTKIEYNKPMKIPEVIEVVRHLPHNMLLYLRRISQSTQETEDFIGMYKGYNYEEPYHLFIHGPMVKISLVEKLGVLVPKFEECDYSMPGVTLNTNEKKDPVLEFLAKGFEEIKFQLWYKGLEFFINFAEKASKIPTLDSKLPEDNMGENNEKKGTF